MTITELVEILYALKSVFSEEKSKQLFRKLLRNLKAII